MEAVNHNRNLGDGGATKRSLYEIDAYSCKFKNQKQDD